MEKTIEKLTDVLNISDAKSVIVELDNIGDFEACTRLAAEKLEGLIHCNGLVTHISYEIEDGRRENIIQVFGLLTHAAQYCNTDELSLFCGIDISVLALSVNDPNTVLFSKNARRFPNVVFLFYIDKSGNALHLKKKLIEHGAIEIN